MNRFAALGLTIAALRDRKRILVVVPVAAMIRDAMDEVIRSTDEALTDAYTVRRHNGAERIDFRSGGRIRFKSIGQGVRGESADVVFLDADVDARMHSEAAWHDLALVAGADGEIVRA